MYVREFGHQFDLHMHYVRPGSTPFRAWTSSTCAARDTDGFELTIIKSGQTCECCEFGHQFDLHMRCMRRGHGFSPNTI